MIHFVIFLLLATILAAPLTEENKHWNINQKNASTNMLEYSTTWENHTYYPSPKNWRTPFYTLMVDRFADGNPDNNDIYKTNTETDMYEVNFRFGGDVQGVIDHLDYIVSMGFKGIYIAGSPLENLLWDYHGYNNLDLTLLDRHLGTVNEWRRFMEIAHSRGILVMVDLTLATMGDLLAFDGHLNKTCPFKFDLDEKGVGEYRVFYKTERTYTDFEISNTWNPKCELPQFWGDDGNKINLTRTHGCMDSEFDQNGDMEAFGVHPPWKRQLGKFFGVQDRLRCWRPSVEQKLIKATCLLIESLDFDAFRVDKATQMTEKFTKAWANGVRKCAKKIGKDNFFVPGEITAGLNLGAVFLGRGKEPIHWAESAVVASQVDNSKNVFLREKGNEGLDSACFHYSIYRNLLRFLGLDGNLEASFDIDHNFQKGWNDMAIRDDLVNANTGLYDIRHMYGAGNQDVFRWPSIKDGKERFFLASIITHLVLPGIPLTMWGEEQGFYIHETRAENYIFGRQPMASSIAWQLHGCFKGNASGQYRNMPFGSNSRNGCHDDTVSLDHFDPTNPYFAETVILNSIRKEYPILNDGYNQTQLKQWTHKTIFPGSNGVSSTFGLWSVLRTKISGQPDLSNNLDGATNVWILYHNENTTITYSFDCTSTDAILSPFNTDDLANIFPPYEEFKTESIRTNTNKREVLHCLRSITLVPYGYAALVPKGFIKRLPTMLIASSPTHDQRIKSNKLDEVISIPLSLEFSDELTCEQIVDSISFEFSSLSSVFEPFIDPQSIVCESNYGLKKSFRWSAILKNVADGIYQLKINRITTADRKSSTPPNLKLMFRVGKPENVMVFPSTSRFDSNFISKSSTGSYLLSHKAIGANKYRFSLDYGLSFSLWKEYSPITDIGAAHLEHINVVVDYWSKLGSSSAHRVHSTSDPLLVGEQRRFPSLYVKGEFNQWGTDYASVSKMKYSMATKTWQIPLIIKFPARIQIDVHNDNLVLLGDVDGDGILDRLPPNSFDMNMINITSPDYSTHLGWILHVDDVSRTWHLTPTGNQYIEIALFLLLVFGPFTGGVLAVFTFRRVFYKVMINDTGRIVLDLKNPDNSWKPGNQLKEKERDKAEQKLEKVGAMDQKVVLIATLEYEIPDWDLKVRIGGLGVMSSLMAKYMKQKILWVIPKVGDKVYPEGDHEDSIVITILGRSYSIRVSSHTVQDGKLKYILLDADVFRARTSKDPYPSRMDDLESAIFYSAWNQCIAAVMTREPVDLYHINDFHGTLAPLHLLPKYIPCVLILHNAEFQGLWPLRNEEERRQVCSAFNISLAVCKKYCQFGNTFNLLFAGASYLRIHQKGLGAAAVSDRYGGRSHERYPTLWGIANCLGLPNPNPQDVGDQSSFDKKALTPEDITLEKELRKGRKIETQQWANLSCNLDAELIVFVGRWSHQKGIDLIADLVPEILEHHPKTQVICIGPTIDLYGKLAATKLAAAMLKFPGRLYSKPEFTMVPKFVNQSCDFVLIPSRDEPFGLVAVEFGRHGVLGIGSFVGGLGSMPGWWFPIESSEVHHLHDQFRNAISQALGSSQEYRDKMRHVGLEQRFPVEEWLYKTNKLYLSVIKQSEKSKLEIIRGGSLTAKTYNFSEGSGLKRSMTTSNLPRKWNFNSISDEQGLQEMDINNPISDITSKAKFTLLNPIMSGTPMSPSPSPSSSPVSSLRKSVSQNHLNRSLSLKKSPSLNQLGKSVTKTGISLSSEIDRSPYLQVMPYGKSQSSNSISSFESMSSTNTGLVRSTTIRPERSLAEVKTHSTIEINFDKRGSIPLKSNLKKSKSSSHFKISKSSDLMHSSPMVEKVNSRIRSASSSENHQGRETSPLFENSPVSTQTGKVFQSPLANDSQKEESKIDIDEERRSKRSGMVLAESGSQVVLSDLLGIPKSGVIQNSSDIPILPELRKNIKRNNRKGFVSASPSEIETTMSDSQKSLDNCDAPNGKNKFHSHSCLRDEIKQEDEAESPKSNFDKANVDISSMAEADDISDASTIADDEEMNLDELKFDVVANFSDYCGGQPFEMFNDPNGSVIKEYEKKLGSLDAKTSSKELCIHTFLSKTENSFFKDARKNALQTKIDFQSESTDSPGTLKSKSSNPDDGSSLEIAVLMQKRVKGWPLYAILLALGQLMAVNSFQVVLLSGTTNMRDFDFYMLGGCFLLGTIVFSTLWRTRPAVNVLTMPFFMYSISFLLVSFPFSSFVDNTYFLWISRISIWLYSFAAASGSLFFSLNFGEENGVEISKSINRASLMEGIRLLWLSTLYFWGKEMDIRNNQPVDLKFPGEIIRPPINWTLFILGSIFSVSFFVIGVLLRFGLPNFYRQIPPALPALITSLSQRKLVLWYFVSEVIRNYWLSGAYGKNWAYLWSQDIHPAIIASLIVLFFVIIWGLSLKVFAKFSQTHSWLLPIFAVGLLAPRWAQMWWSISFGGVNMAWASGGGSYLGLILWLWLGLLDAIQAVGFGLMLLQTLTRLHVTAVMLLAQTLGSIATMLARAMSPSIPDVFPSAGSWDPGSDQAFTPFNNGYFWGSLLSQLVIALGYLFWFRKEELSRP